MYWFLLKHALLVLHDVIFPHVNHMLGPHGLINP
jgi:hypothetical protein